MSKNAWPPILLLLFLALSAPAKIAASPPVQILIGAEYNYGNLSTGHNVLPANYDPMVIVKNRSAENLTLTLSAIITGGMTLGSGLGDTGIDRCVMAVVFRNPAHDPSLGMFANNDVLGPSAFSASETRYADDADPQTTCKGFALAPNDERQLCFLLQTPTRDTTWEAPQTIHVTLSTLEHPEEVVHIELTFAIVCGCDFFGFPPHTFEFGAVEKNSSTLSNPDPRIIVRNYSPRTLNYTISASLSGGMTLGTHLGDVGPDRAVLAAIFTDYARTLAPADFGDEDVLGDRKQASETVFASAGDTPQVMGFSVGAYQERSLRFYLQAPTLDTTGGAEQAVQLTFQCLEQLQYPQEATITFRVYPGTPTTTATVSPTPTISATFTATPKVTPTLTVSETATISATWTTTLTSTPSSTITETATATPTLTQSPTVSDTPTLTPPLTDTPPVTETATPQAPPSATATPYGPAPASPTPILTAGREASRQAVSAYPNPARGLVNFVYSAPDAARITIDIFRLDGERVATLAERPVCGAGGTFTTAWRAAGVAPGVYLCLIRITDSAGRELVRQTRKVALLQ